MQLVLGEPPAGLRGPVLLAGFGGWGDAGSAASIALRHVLGDPAPPASAMLDPSACYDFTVARPLSTRSADGRRWSLEYPQVAFYPLRLPGAQRELQDTDYEGPTAFVTALLHAAAAGGITAASLWVATPPYLQAGNPVAALALLEATCKVTRLPLEIERLREVADTFLHDVEAALEEHPELAEQLKEMLEAEEDDEDEEGFELHTRAHWRGPDPDRPPPDAPPGLPSGKALVEAVEKYLRQRKDDEDDPAPPSGPVALPLKNHKRLIALAASVATCLAGLDLAVVSTAMPTVVRQLGGLELYAWTF